MGQAIFTGVTGLLAHQRRMDVVANNIANVNTTGYRGSRVIFQDLFSQTLQGAAAPNGAFGGTNPMQVGLGVGVGSIDVIHNQGSLLNTGLNSDLAVQGNGFFVMTDGATRLYSRDGSFQVNANGVLVDPATGMRVQGYMADANGVIDTADELGDLTVPIGNQSIVRATANAVMIGNLTSDAAAADTVQHTIRVYDSLGAARDIQLTFTKLPANGQWQWSAATTDPDIQSITAGGTIQFDDNGAFVSSTSNQVQANYNPAGPALPVNPFTFDVDFASMTQLAGDSDISLHSQDGFERGVLESFSIGRNGVINGVFTNGLMQAIGQVAVATFPNVGGLARSGNNMFEETPASGQGQVGLPATGGRGEVVGGVL
ncbi:MAG: Flagellar hook protein FlgE, partial [Candidatus Hydrogenedentes bacterium]|nr:Flagellar hook protein FlgE [Candidatus Hydrogenedentota bacterium]